jgi:hypothetical protein
MKWHITRKRLLAIIVLLFLTLAAFGLWGCTKREEAAAIKTGGAISGAVGLPPYVGESIVTLAFSIAAWLNGQNRGRKKERACHVQKAQPVKVATP